MILLNQIAEQTNPNNSTIWVTLIASVATLCASGVGALLLYFGTTKQIKSTIQLEEKKLQASIVTAERLRWLQELRTRSSEFYANLDMHYNLLKRSTSRQNEQQVQEQYDKIAQNIMIQCNQIIFLLNPHKTQQEIMCNACNDALEFFQLCVDKRNKGELGFDDNKYGEIKTIYFDSLIKIGAETWKQIKELS